MILASRRIVSCAAVVVLAVPVAAACDFRPDQCEIDENVCDGNVANQCNKPGVESRLQTTRIDCGSTSVCAVASAPGLEGGEPLCIPLAPEACNIAVDTGRCANKLLSRCTALVDGRTVWVDSYCAKGGTAGAKSARPRRSAARAAFPRVRVVRFVRFVRAERR